VKMGNPSPVLITGAAGFIGSHVAQYLLARGQPVVGLDNFDPFYPAAAKQRNLREISTNSNFTFIEGDITDPAVVTRAAAGVEGVIHLAAKAGVRPSIADPAGYMRANVVGTSVVLEAAKLSKASRVVVASSSSVYGNNPKVPFSETDDVSRPISPYAASKRATELVCSAHQHLTGMPTACLRFFTVFGPRQRPDLAIQQFIARIIAGETIKMFGDGTTSRDYTYIDDIVRGVVAAYDRIASFKAPEDGTAFRIWNLGGSSPVSLREMIAAIERVVGREAKIERISTQPGDVERTFADLSRSARELDFKPRTRLEEGIAMQLAWHRASAPVHS
jgi:UDP-glucuronate 4-epimerase